MPGRRAHYAAAATFALTCLCAAVTARAQTSADPAPLTDVEFVDATRSGIARFQKRSAAIAAGYRRLGPSFPGMGEHWIHPGLIVRRTITPGSPPVLCYAEVDGEPRLVAVAYAFPLKRGAPLPPLPGGSHAWHEHDGAVDEEALLFIHPSAAGSSGAGVRLVMTHVWTGLDNDDGVFAQNNWRLPFVQAGLALTTPPDMVAAQAVSLLTAGTDYYVRLFDARASPTDGDRAAITAVLAGAHDRIAAWLAAHAGAFLGENELEALRAEWARMWAELEASVGVATAARLRGTS